MLKKTFTLLLLPAIFVACAGKKNVNLSETPILSMKTSSCLGECESFDVTIYDNGAFSFMGKENTNFVGSKIGKLEKTELIQLNKILEEVDLLSLSYEPNKSVKDLPVIYMNVYQGKTSTEIRYSYPREERIDKVIKLIREFLVDQDLL